MPPSLPRPCLAELLQLQFDARLQPPFSAAVRGTGDPEAPVSALSVAILIEIIRSNSGMTLSTSTPCTISEKPPKYLIDMPYFAL
jgi:hypothetical protein